MLGILAPMPEEIDLLLSKMEGITIHETGKRKYYVGELNGLSCVAALSRIGKVASAVTAAIMIEKFQISQLVVIGVAGAISPLLKPGDIVVANSCVQHDLDARPLFPQFEAPLLNKSFFDCDQKLVSAFVNSTTHFLKHSLPDYLIQDDIKEFDLDHAKILVGQLCCGDQFIGSKEQLEKIRKELPDAVCVEMEGGAVGQVCYEYQIPYVVVRTISDYADGHAHIDFEKYIQHVAKKYTLGILWLYAQQQKNLSVA